MKKIILSVIIISLLSITTIFADNNTNTNSIQQSSISTQQNSNTAVVTINDMNGKLVYTQTFILDNQNDSNIKLNPDHKLSKGTYVVTLIVDGERMTQKLIVE